MCEAAQTQLLREIDLMYDEKLRLYSHPLLDKLEYEEMLSQEERDTCRAILQRIREIDSEMNKKWILVDQVITQINALILGDRSIIPLGSKRKREDLSY